MPSLDDGIVPWLAEAWQKLSGRGQWPHSLLLTGREGIGKLAFAKHSARGLLCERPPAPNAVNACGACPSCAWFGSAIHPDFMLLTPDNATSLDAEKSRDGQSKAGQMITIDRIRQLNEFVSVAPQRDIAKVIVIYPAEALNPNAANALLKMLEEPPPAVFFLLVSHNPYRLLPTLLSRCQRIHLPAPEQHAASTWLAQQGAYQAEPQAELGLAQASCAPLRAAELDVDYWKEREIFLRHLAQSPFAPMEAAAAMQRVDPGRVLDWLVKWVYDLILLKLAGKIRYHLDRRAALDASAENLSVREGLRNYRDLTGMQAIINHPLNPRLLIEEIMLKHRHLRLDDHD